VRTNDGHCSHYCRHLTEIRLAGSAIRSVVASDPTSSIDFADTLDDVDYVAHTRSATDWGWFQEGYDQEPGQPSAAASLEYYVTHHNGPQYFGYIANSSERSNLHGLGDFMKAVSTGTLSGSGVFYVKGGEHNIMGLKPSDPDAKVQANFNGDDDHPGYSDAQISEALVAENINRIVSSKYWNQSAIIVTYDDSEGDYDHVPPPLRSIGPGVGNVPADFLSDGPRVPLLVISPFAKVHDIEHAYGDQGSVVKFVDEVFGLSALSNLPDEQKARRAAETAGKFNYGPDDDDTNGITDLLGAFDQGRLNGTRPPLPASYAYVEPSFINHLPQQTGLGCRAIGVIPVDYLQGIDNHIPADFNPRPGTDPTAANVKPLNTRRVVNSLADLDD
jgi:phospholipase C